MNSKKINLINLIPKDTRIILNSKFREYLFERLFGLYSKTALTKKYDERRSYHDWYTGRRSPPFSLILDICKLLNINKKELFSNIVYLTSYYKSGSIKICNPYIKFDEEFAEWFGLVKGDGSISKKYVYCSNTKLPLIFQFTQFLENRFSVKKSQFKIGLRVPIEKTKNDFWDTLNFIKKKGYYNIVVSKRNEKYKRRELLFTAVFNSKLLATIILKIQENLYNLLENSPNKVKAAFIRGYSAAEGSVGDRRIKIYQNDIKELKFIKKLLISIGFRHVSNPEKVGNNGYRLSIYTNKELKRFCKEIGFGKNKVRNQKLKNLIDGYIYDEYKTRKQRYKEFFDIIKLNIKVTAPFIAKITNNDYKYTSQLLKEMIKLGMIKVIMDSKPYFYLIE